MTGGVRAPIAPPKSAPDYGIILIVSFLNLNICIIII